MLDKLKKIVLSLSVVVLFALYAFQEKYRPSVASSSVSAGQVATVTPHVSGSLSTVSATADPSATTVPPTATRRAATVTPTESDAASTATVPRSEEHTSELQSLRHLVCRLLLE